MPKVSFIVPCYKLAHYLPECLNSILQQTVSDYEIIIMDDASPDDTSAVVGTFKDSRIQYVRNETNLRHLRNYNKGITMSKGEIFWLLSADDLLCRPDALADYLSVFDAHPEVGLVFSPSYGYQDKQQREIMFGLGNTVDQNKPTTYPAQKFYEKLIWSNCVPAPSGVARRTCFDKVGGFPLDLPHAGDYYHWVYYSLYFGVGYVPRAATYYRLHETNMHKALLRSDRLIPINDEINVRWRMLEETRGLGNQNLIHLTEKAIANDYATRMWRKIESDWVQGFTPEEFEGSLADHKPDPELSARIRALAYSYLADSLFDHHRRSEARTFYKRALGAKAGNGQILTKWALRETRLWSIVNSARSPS